MLMSVENICLVTNPKVKLSERVLFSNPHLYTPNPPKTPFASPNPPINSWVLRRVLIVPDLMLQTNAHPYTFPPTSWVLHNHQFSNFQACPLPPCPSQRLHNCHVQSHNEPDTLPSGPISLPHSIERQLHLHLAVRNSSISSTILLRAGHRNSSRRAFDSLTSFTCECKRSGAVLTPSLDFRLDPRIPPAQLQPVSQMLPAMLHLRLHPLCSSRALPLHQASMLPM